MIVVSYKSSYTNTCRGCTMESYGSDFQMHHFVSPEEAIEHCSQLNAQTHFDQLFGENAWEHHIIQDGFENQLKIDQCYDPDIDGDWKSYGTYCPGTSYDEEIKKRTKEIYDGLIANKKAQEKAQLDQKNKEKLERDIANAKALLAQHKEL